MKRFVGFLALALAAFAVALTFTPVDAAVVNNTLQLPRARYLAGVMNRDSSVFILEGNSGSAPTCYDTTAAFYIGNHVLNGGNFAGTTNAVPMFILTVSGVPTGVAVDSIRAFVDYSMSKNGPWLTAGEAVPTGWDVTCTMVAPTAASDSTGAGATKALYAAGSTAISPLSTRPVYKGVLQATSVTAGTLATSPLGWQYARFRLTGDKTTGTLSSLFGARVWVSFPVNVSDPASPGEPQ